MLMGSAESVPEPPPVQTVFVEDMPESEKRAMTATNPGGLVRHSPRPPHKPAQPPQPSHLYFQCTDLREPRRLPSRSYRRGVTTTRTSSRSCRCTIIRVVMPDAILSTHGHVGMPTHAPTHHQHTSEDAVACARMGQRAGYATPRLCSCRLSRGWHVLRRRRTHRIEACATTASLPALLARSPPPPRGLGTRGVLTPLRAMLAGS